MCVQRARSRMVRSSDCETRLVGLSGAVASLVVVVSPVTHQVTGRLVRAFGMIRPGVRRRRSGARCWLDQELVRPGGVTHHSPAAAVSLHSDRRHRTLRVESEDRGMLADQVDYVVGVDTHRDEHVLAVVTAPAGAVVAQRSVPATARGYAEALRFAAEHAPAARVWAVEGAGHYGAGLARYLSGHGETVLEAGRGPRNERAAAREGRPAGRGTGGPDGARERDARSAASRTTAGGAAAASRRSSGCGRCPRREALVQLRSVIVTAPDQLRSSYWDCLQDG
jgi:hypothetical protein